ncbi:MAG: NYN domain-containing protein [Candidatus Parcubacteria bacterium]|nr:NYN domain-containing protein [Candidatus Parcubacteria bacterium]
MILKENNYAYIDGANLYKGVESLGWRLDYKRFRVWLKDKYRIAQAYIFIGLVPKHKELYTYLQECGFTLIFKPKGNCDADLVLRSVIDFYEKRCEKAIIVTSDGDYAGLVKFLIEKDSLLTVVSPGNKCSYLLRKLNTPIVYLNTQKNKLRR